MLNAARYQKDTSRMGSVYSTPSGCNQESAHAIPAYVAHGDSIEAKRVSGCSAGVSAHEMPIFARVEVSTSSTDSGSGILPCADNKIGVTVAIHVASHRGARSESLASRFPCQGKKLMAIFPGMNIDASCGWTLRIIGPVGRVDIRHAVAIHIAQIGRTQF